MAGLTKEQRAAKAAAQAEGGAGDSNPEAHADAPALVTMVKAGEPIDVHPTCVRAHMEAGWKLADA